MPPKYFMVINSGFPDSLMIRQIVGADRREIDYRLLTRGTPVDPEEFDPVFAGLVGGPSLRPLPFFLTHALLPVTTVAAFRGLAITFPGAVQFISGTVASDDEVVPIALFNVLTRIDDAIDESRSRFDRYPADYIKIKLRDRIATMSKLVVDSERLNGSHITWVDSYLIVSEAFVKFLVDRGVAQGVRFVPVT